MLLVLFVVLNVVENLNVLVLDELAVGTGEEKGPVGREEFDSAEKSKFDSIQVELRELAQETEEKLG